ncbi:hypothetical protein F53441_13854 [Fusarium austroafricanum]|uniref:PARP catalytic domain-containing protein n=1 Tax=Fusarium austroafricanum TaxID=2364996 RepID=A0A8H4JMQ7_9HYPO|nr:hypothetical protein F53441_13854 [Fusarium austroafricanum]
MPPQLYRLDKNSPDYKELEKGFLASWEHPNKRIPIIQSIYRTRGSELQNSYRMKRWNKHKDTTNGEYDYLWHGTRRCCYAGEPGGLRGQGQDEHVRWCNQPTCGLCGILKKSFQVSKSEADNFANNALTNSKVKVILICSVVTGRVQYLRNSCSNRLAPDPGFDSVEGVLIADGGLVNYPEMVVYRDDAIVPMGLIVYYR